MDKELMEEIIKLKVQGKILRGLADVILDNTYLGYDGELRLTNEDRILTVIKTFYGDECSNRLKELKAEKQAEIEQARSKGIETEVE
jgi:hypothetical protein